MATAAQLTKTIKLHRKQYEFRHSPELFRAFVGGRGAGKSFAGAYDLIRRARRDRSYLVGSPTGILMQDTTYPTFKKLAEELGVWQSVKLTPWPTAVIRTEKGTAEIRFRTAEDPEKMRGPNLSGAWLDEASLMQPTAYDIAIACLREAGEQGWLSSTFTPKGPSHWTYETFATGKQNTAIFKAHTGSNPFLPPGFEATLQAQYGETQFSRQELGGDFVQLEGAEFPAEWFDWPGFWFDEWPAEWRFKVVYLDPSKGRDAKTADYQAYVMALLGKDNTIYLDAELNKEPTPAMIARGVRICKEWGPVDSLALEDNGTMGFMEPEIVRQTQEAGILIPWQTVTSREPKLFRIRGLGGYLSRRQIRIRNTPGGRLLRAQLGDVPIATSHDDGPDAAAGAVRRLEQLTMS